MQLGTIVFICLAVLFILLACGLWIGIALAITGLLGIVLGTGYPPGPILTRIAWNCCNSFLLTALPLFIFMGEILIRTQVTKHLFTGLSPIFSHIPGRLLHVNVIACSIFAAVSGSSAATTATVGSITFEEFRRRNYDIRLACGSLAGSGTLGLLIPPSLVMILYGALTGVSVGQLFMGGFFPGFLVALLFMSYIGFRATLNPSVSPATGTYSWKDILVSIPRILPIFLLILLVLGSIYLGIATPTESAAFGVIGAIIVSMISRTFSWKALWESSLGAVVTTAMIFLILIGAFFLGTAAAYLRVPAVLAEIISGWSVSRYIVLTLFGLFYLALGCFFDGGSMLVMTIPVVFPVIIGLGFDPLWLGVFLVILIETAQITPPVGINLYIIRKLTGLEVTTIIRHTLPFFFLLLMAAVIITIWPQIALWLPSTMVR